LLTTNDSGLAEYARSLRFHGKAERPYEYDKAGNDWFMNEILAVLGVHQLRKLEQFIERRRQLANFYRTYMQSLRRITFFTEGEGKSVYYKLPVLLDTAEALNHLRKYWDTQYGLECEPLYYPPCHMQPVFANNPDIDQFQCTEAERILPRQFCLPIHLRLTDDEAMEVVKSLERFFNLDI
jgi:perosamine synthetase